jgi:hypothetical protein
MKIFFDERTNDFVYSAGTPKWIVTDVQPQTNYTLLLTFTGGEKRLYNALPLLEKKIYSPLKNLAFFMSAKVAGDTVVWSDEVDIAPEHLYKYSNPIDGMPSF